MAAKDELGRRGEDLAARWLESAGIAVLERNWRCRGGEIDIVGRDGRTLVVCEVKTRTTVGFGSPLEAITPTKLARLRRLAGQWIEDHAPSWLRAVRIDVVGVLWPAGSDPTVEHLRGVEP